jgi:uncharacterized membrane protein YkoI
MIKKTLITVVVIVAILGIVFAAYGNNNTKNSTNTSNSTNPQKVIDKVNNTATNNNNSQTTITPTEAQKIAKTFIEVSGATAGTPKLVNQEGTLMYIVPVINNNTVVGEIDIDAKTGKNLGGAGGAP